MMKHYGLVRLFLLLMVSGQAFGWSAPITISSSSAGTGRLCLALADGPPQTLYFAYRISNSLAYNSFDVDAVSVGSELRDRSNLYGFSIGCALDAGGDFAISHGDVSSDSTFVATFASGAFAKTTLASRNKYGSGTALSVDTSGAFHVFYYDSTEDDLKYLTNVSGVWDATNNEEILDATGDVGREPVVATDSNGMAHVAYLDITNTAVKYVTNASGAWSTPVTVASNASQPSIAVDSDDNVHLAYLNHDVDMSKGLYYHVMYATNASGAWVSETVDDDHNALYETAIATTAPQAVHIAYRNHSGAALQYATNQDGAWAVSATPIDSGTVGSYLAMVADSGSLYLAYLDEDDDTVKLVYNTCGDAVVDASEACDDGNSVDDDECANNCQFSCGNGTVNGSEECDDGDSVDTNDCTNDCLNPTCGDSVVWSGHETCDDGNTTTTDSCPAGCAAASCGDGYFWSTDGGTEQCDDGDTDDHDGCTNSCTAARCGDSILWNTGGGTETCDDGNTTVGDGCDSLCRREFAPLANAGRDLTVTYGTGSCGPTCTLFYLDGRLSSDPDLDAITYSWAKTSQPLGSTVAIAASTSARTAVRVNLRGTYVFTLTVTDADGYTATDTVQFTVR